MLVVACKDPEFELESKIRSPRLASPCTDDTNLPQIHREAQQNSNQPLLGTLLAAQSPLLNNILLTCFHLVAG